MSEEKKYKKTLNLPQTTFPMKASLAKHEPEALESWNEFGLFEKIQEKHKKSQEKFILHDGPPYANGHIHIGHSLNKILKDIIVKFKTMQGFDAAYIPGWDCHGLPIELQAMKELDKKKDEIDTVEFRKQARDYAARFVAVQKEEFKRLGVMGDWQNPYLTMNYEYQSTIADSFLELYEKGFIEQRLKPVPWCYESETALADAELEYEDKVSKSIFVKFPAMDEDHGKKVFFLVWTTTPWTLPANVGIAVHPKLDYVVLENDCEQYILAKSLQAKLTEKLGLGDCEAIKVLKGSELEGWTYRHPFLDRQGKTILAEYVSAEDGTGIVHIAPGHGEDDYVHGYLKNKLPILCPVDEKGRFTAEFSLFEGMNVFRANPKIVELLEEKKALLLSEDHQHSYPFSSRGHVPIIFRATKQWFLKIDHNELRPKILKALAKDVKFHPEWGHKRFSAMIEGRPDWCLSRQRFWGVPIPVIYDKASKKFLISESRKKIVELFRKKGADVWYELDAIEFLDDKVKGSYQNENLTKETDILDVWFDSGVSHQAVLKKRAELKYPCDLYLEGSDQHRGWFQVAMITSMALEGKAPYRSILTHGFVVDGEGKKMSKSKGNVISPEQVFNQFGADVLRLWVSSCDYQFDVRLSREILDRMVEAYRRIRNTFRYMLGNCGDFDVSNDYVPFREMESVDRWAVSKVMLLTREVTELYEKFEFYHIYKAIHEFCTVSLSNFYLDILKDRMYCDGKTSHTRKSSQTAFFIILKQLVRLLTPILPFTCDEVWKSFPFDHSVENVHLADWPLFEEGFYDAEAYGDWQELWRVRNHVNFCLEKKREEGLIGSALEAHVHLATDDDRVGEFLKKYDSVLPFALIVSKVSVADSESAKGWSVAADEFYGKKVQLSILVEKVVDNKCERCWNYRPTVGQDVQHPSLCRRCSEAVSDEMPVS